MIGIHAWSLVLVGLLAACTRTPPPDVVSPAERAARLLLDVAADPDRLASSSGMDLLQAALAVDPASLDARTRVIVQNDLWGSAQRLRLRGDPTRAAELASAVAWAWALPAQALTTLDGQRLPAAARALLPEREGYLEHSSEHQVFVHERAFGLRRVFRLVLAGERRALVSQLIAFDRDGAPHLTDVVGEIERLQFDGHRLNHAQVLHLDRHRQVLEEVEYVDQIPSHGATSTIVGFRPPRRVAELPCVQCHDDAQMMSLPLPTEDPSTRIAHVLGRARAEVPPRPR